MQRSRSTLLALLLAAGVILGMPAAAGAQAGNLISGDLPPEGGVALITVTAEATVSEVVGALAVEGCSAVTLAVTSGGTFITYVPGAPEFVNVAFPASFAASSPLAIRCAAGTPAEPTVQDAVETLESYFAAINAGLYQQAYETWGDTGAASGQTFEEFRAGFDETVSVAVGLGEPGQIEAAAGSRYIEVPIEITSTLVSGEVQTFTGTYVLRRSVVDGATQEQRAWSIYSADVTAAP